MWMKDALDDCSSRHESDSDIISLDDLQEQK
jgi:hypothetical protein